MRYPKLDEPLCLTLHAVRRWVCRHLGSVEHERRVAAIGAAIFDLTSPMHDLESSHRRLLRIAALVHDVGRSVDDATHPAEGARLILADDQLPLKAAERRCLAYLTLYHRGSVPALGRDAVLSKGDDHESLLRILAFLRTADALDGRSMEPTHLSFRLSSGRLQVRCLLPDDSAKARRLYRRRKKFRLLEDLLDCRLDFDVSVPRSFELVA